jgi:hypothetical protein
MDIRNRWDLSRLTSPVLMGLTRSLASGFDALADLAEGAARALGAESAPAPSPVPGGPVAVRSGTEEQPARSENRGCITVDGSDERALFDYYKADLSQVDSGSNHNLSAFALAALEPDPHGARYREAGNWAVLTNEGEIRMSMRELLRRFGPEMTAPGDLEPLPSGKRAIREGRRYLSLMLWGMLGGCESTLINNGRILTLCDTDDPEGTENVFTHPMYVYHRSVMVNNGEVLVCGEGNRGINPRGLTSQKNDLTIVNNGRIVLDVENAYLSRALTVAGCGSSLLNRGLVRASSGGTVFGVGHSGSSTLVNEGTVEVTTRGVVPKESIGVLSTFTARAGVYGLSASGSDDLMEQLHDKFGVRNWKGEGICNRGVVKAAVRGDGADPRSVAAGVLVLDAHLPYNGWYTLRNTGLIQASSDLRPCPENHGQVASAELVVNCVHMPEKTYPVRARIWEWATELRDFAQSRDFILARSDSDGPVKLHFADAELILRPAEGYCAGTAYRVSAQTLVTPMDAPTLEAAGVEVTGMEHLRLRTEVPELLTAHVEETAPGDYQVSLHPAEDERTQRRLLSAAVLGPVDVERLTLDELDRMLDEGPDWSAQTWHSSHSREDGMTGQTQGFAARREVGIPSLFRAGVHAALARDRSVGDLYHASGSLNASLEGAHCSLLGGLLRAQVTRWHTGGGTDFALHTDTGIRLDGRADGALSGSYACAHLGRQLRLGRHRRLFAQAGLSCLLFGQGSSVDWSFKGEPLPGYRMETEAGQSVRGTLRLGWKQLFRGGRDGHFSLSLEGSAALSDSGAGARMLGTALSGRVREDPVQFRLDASLRRRLGDWTLNASVRCGIGKSSRHSGFSFTLRPDSRTGQPGLRP